ncbi:MAG: hypothetical protein J6J60_00780 [Clostridia bacterium]|nr:hypothetical protein [Clostridia bacterium]
MKKKTLIICSIILAIMVIITCMVIFINKNIESKDTTIANNVESLNDNSIIGQNNKDNIVATDIETEDETTDIVEENTKEKLQETKDEIIKETEEKKDTVIKTNDNNNQDTKDKEEKEQVITNDKTVTTEKTEDKSVTDEKSEKTQEKETPKTNIPETPQTNTNEDVKEEETKKIDLSKYDYYEESLNGTYKGYIKDTNEMAKLKSLIDECIKEFGYTNVTVKTDSSLPRSGLGYFTANKTNVENLVYDTEDFTIYYYAVKEYHIAADGKESLFQSRSYIQVK